MSTTLKCFKKVSSFLLSMFLKVVIFISFVKITEDNVFVEAYDYANYKDLQQQGPNENYKDLQQQGPNENYKDLEQQVPGLDEQDIEQFKRLSTYNPDKPLRVNYDVENITDFPPHEVNLYFDLFRFYYLKEYNDTEYEKGRKTFGENIKLMIKLTIAMPTASFKMNEFTDIKLDEFTKYFTGFNRSKLYKENNKEFRPNTRIKPPEEFDWSTINEKFYTVPRHQGKCKSSYIFSAMANIELQIMRKYNYDPGYLSVQQPYDCERTGNCQHGGLPHLAMQSILRSSGASVEEYRYKLNRTYNMKKPKQNCSYWISKREKIAAVTNVIRFKVRNEDDLKAALYEHGPITTAIYVSEYVKNYKSGILTGLECDKEPNHAVLLVGYGVSDENMPFWILRNSWGAEWGEKGYFFLERGKRTCGIGGYLASVTVKLFTSATTTTTSTTTTTTTPPPPPTLPNVFDYETETKFTELINETNLFENETWSSENDTWSLDLKRRKRSLQNISVLLDVTKSSLQMTDFTSPSEGGNSSLTDSVPLPDTKTSSVDNILTSSNSSSFILKDLRRSKGKSRFQSSEYDSEQYELEHAEINDKTRTQDEDLSTSSSEIETKRKRKAKKSKRKDHKKSKRKNDKNSKRNDDSSLETY